MQLWINKKYETSISSGALENISKHLCNDLSKSSKKNYFEKVSKQGFC